jgi:hypothetical protein
VRGRALLDEKWLHEDLYSSPVACRGNRAFGIHERRLEVRARKRWTLVIAGKRWSARPSRDTWAGLEARDAP